MDSGWYGINGVIKIGILISIENGRNRLYQWDLNQRIILYEVNVGEEVHYAHRNDYNDNALVVKTYSENNKIYANIPNILLQVSGDMDVYVYVTVGNDQHTEKHFILRVEQREKPSDYVYTETETLTWKSLDERITELESGSQSPMTGATADTDGASGLVPQPKAGEQAKFLRGDGTWADVIASGGLTSAQINALDGMFKIAAYTGDPTTAYSAFKSAFGISDSGGGESGGGESGGGGETEKTLESISATYTGGDVEVGTALTDLTGILVTATYSDGSTETVTGYTLSGEIAEGVNIITVSYGGLTATFTVTGVDSSTSVTYTVTNNLTNVTNSNSQTNITDGYYSATLTVDEGNTLESVTITMGGEDITDSVYTADTGSILITEVTGDIVITAVASALAYVDMASSVSTDIVKVYSDNGSTTVTTKYYQSGKYSKNRTETNATVKVRLINNTESGISTSNVYIGSTDEQAIRNPNSTVNMYYAKSGNKGTVAAGSSVEVEYTLQAGHWLYLFGFGDLTVEVIGALDIREIGETLATTSKKIDSFTVYSDDGSTQIEKVNYRTAYATTEQFDSDTVLIVTITSPGLNSGNILMGCITSGTLTANVSAYYGKQRVVKSFATGAVVSYEFTVKAGHYFAIVPCNNGTFYIERA